MSFMKNFAVTGSLVATILLAGCGGGGGGANDRIGAGGGSSGGGSGGISTSKAAAITLLASSPTLSSSASDSATGVTLTAIVKDASNNVLAAEPVAFSTADSAGLIVPSPSITNAGGQAQATLTTGGDPMNRTITVLASSGSVAATVTVAVVGTTLSITGADSTQFNVPTVYTVQLSDSAQKGIPGQVVSLSTQSANTVASTNVKTDSSGQVKLTFTGRVASSSITATSLGLTAVKNVVVSTDEFGYTSPIANSENGTSSAVNVTVRWFQNGAAVPDGTRVDFSATRGLLSASSATTSAGLATIMIQSSESGFSTISASSQALTKPSAVLSIEFVATNPTSIDVQAAPAVIATNQSTEISATVRDAANNLVKNQTVNFSLIDATGGTLSSPSTVTDSQGTAKIRYAATSRSSASRGVEVTGTLRSTGTSDTAFVTVAARAVSITLGTGAQIESKDSSTYALPFTVLVSDSAGNPVPDADFRLSLQPVSFNKGDFSGVTATCPNEDVNFDDVNDPSEDADSDGILEPGRVAVLPSTIDLDDDGSAQFRVTYPKDRGAFVTVRITGVATVSGTEATAIRTLTLPVAESEVSNLPGVSPYGLDASCASPN